MLSLVQGDGTAREWARTRLPSLAAQPFRPGELPSTVAFRLDPQTREIARAGAAASGVPIGLWLRIAVESARHLRAVVMRTRITRSALTSCLDAATESRQSRITATAYEHLAYARLLRRGGHQNPSRGEVATVFLSDQMHAGWLLAAALSGESPSIWAAALLTEVPTRCVEWEAASAAAGSSLGEWILYSALSHLSVAGADG